MYEANRFRKRCCCSAARAGATAVASTGMRPTSEWTRIGVCEPSGPCSWS